MLLPNDNFSALNAGSGISKFAEKQHFKVESLKFVGGVWL